MGERRLRRGVRRALAALAVSAAIAGVAYASTYSWLFAAAEVRVQGVVRMTAAEVRDLGGVAPGVNVFHLDTGPVEARLRADPRIAAVWVRTDLPDAVMVTIVERIPVAIVEVSGALTVVADDGTMLPTVPRGSLPEIQAVAGELDDGRRTAAAGVLAALTPEVRRRFATVTSDAAGDLVLETSDGVTFSYGPATQIEAKADAIDAVLEWADDEQIALVTVDVTAPTAPTARTTDAAVRPG